MANPQGKFEDAADVTAPADTTDTVTRQMAAAQTGKVGTKLGGAQTNAATSAEMVKVDEKLQAGKNAAMTRAKQVKTQRDSQKQKEESQNLALQTQRSSMHTQIEEQKANILNHLSTGRQDMSLSEKLAMGDQMDFLDQMKFEKNLQEYEQEIDMLKTTNAAQRQQLAMIQGIQHALSDQIEENIYLASEYKKTRQFNEANNILAANKKHEATMDQLDQQAKAVMVEGGTSAAKAGVAYGYSNSGDTNDQGQQLDNFGNVMSGQEDVGPAYSGGYTS